MTDEGPATEDPTNEEEPIEVAPAQTEFAPATTSARRWGFAVVRAIVVLGAAAVVYQFVVPQTHVDRSRLAQLVTPTTGVKAFSVKPTSQTEQQASQLGVNALKTASQKAPNRTGVYNVTWQPSATQAAAVYAMLLPDAQQASATLHEVVGQQLSANAFSSNGFTRRSTFSVPGITGSSGSFYTSPATQAGPAAQLAVLAFQEGKTLAVAEVAQGTGAQADAITLGKAQADHLQAIQNGFTLKVVTRSAAATVGWAVGAVCLAAVIGFGPIAWRALAQRRQRRIQEQLDHQVRVGNQVIVKRRV